jgi:ABC-type antimicrobial peptide transport system permease subunit
VSPGFFAASGIALMEGREFENSDDDRVIIVSVREATARHRFLALLLALFGALSMLLAVTGVYGVVALNVNRRTRDVGIRVALGADGREVVRSVLASGLRPVVAGLAIGVVAVLGAGQRLEADVLYRISPSDPLSIALGVALLLSTAAAACSIPASRASRIDPLQALRVE